MTLLDTTLVMFDALNDFVAIALALACFYLLVFERIRLANWNTIQWKYMSVYVLYMLFDLWIVYLAAAPHGVSIFAVFITAGQLRWLLNTRDEWKEGVVPCHMRSAPAPLGPPEMDTRP